MFKIELYFFSFFFLNKQLIILRQNSVIYVAFTIFLGVFLLSKFS